MSNVARQLLPPQVGGERVLPYGVRLAINPSTPLRAGVQEVKSEEPGAGKLHAGVCAGAVG